METSIFTLLSPHLSPPPRRIPSSKFRGKRRCKNTFFLLFRYQMVKFLVKQLLEFFRGASGYNDLL